MYLSRIKIENFRNFSLLDVALAGNVVVVGENRVGKSNLLQALRLILDPTLPDSARQLSISDFWDGLETPDEDDKIVVSIEIKDFEDDLDVLALLTDYRLDNDADTVRLTYEFGPSPNLDEPPAADEDYEFVCYGGENEAKRFGHELRRRITMDVLPALRDAEGDLRNWRRSPLRPLVEAAASGIDVSELNEISEAIEAATNNLTEFQDVSELNERIGELFVQMSGEHQDIEPRLGFSPSDPARLFRNIRLLIDDGRRGINDASLGSANLVFLTLKTLELQRVGGAFGNTRLFTLRLTLSLNHKQSNFILLTSMPMIAMSLFTYLVHAASFHTGRTRIPFSILRKLECETSSTEQVQNLRTITSSSHSLIR